MATYHNIDGSTGINVELIKVGTGVRSIRSILITNTQGSNAATVSLFLQDDPAAASAKTYNILSTVSIPADTSLLLDEESLLTFNNTVYGLYMTVGSSDTLDVLIN
tara:strand:- start:1768 stop:2085 length:318 start_codon:yes stop_codon:yes gene_type:complete